MSKGHGQEEDRRMNRNMSSRIEPMHQILPRLYLGGLIAAENQEGLRSKNISFVLSINHHRSPPSTREAYRKARISHVCISKEESSRANLLEIFEPACDMIEGQLAKGKAVLVHCAKGYSRSATVVIAYVMRQSKLCCPEGLAYVRRKWAVVNLNPNFQKQLQIWERCKYDIQNTVVEDEEPKSFSVGRSCEVKGEERTAKGKDKTTNEAERNQEQVEDEKKSKERKESEVPREGRQSGTSETGNHEIKVEGKAEGNANGKDEQRGEDSAKDDEKAESPLQTEKGPPKTLPSILGIATHCSRFLWDIAKRVSPGADTHTTNPPPPPPAPESIAAAIKCLYERYFRMAKEWILGILPGRGWSIRKTDLWPHLEAPGRERHHRI